MSRLRIPPLTQGVLSSENEDTLSKRYGFSSEESKRVRDRIGFSGSQFMAKRFLHIKSLGINRAQILEAVDELGEDRVFDMRAWEGISQLMLIPHIDPTIARLAWRAGLTSDQYESMDPNARSEAHLRTMASLRHL